jgi:hypothetical protein
MCPSNESHQPSSKLLLHLSHQSRSCLYNSCHHSILQLPFLTISLSIWSKVIPQRLSVSISLVSLQLRTRTSHSLEIYGLCELSPKLAPI